MSESLYYEHFDHGADIGVRGIGESLAQAFEQAALALSAVVIDLDDVQPSVRVDVACNANDEETMLVDWLNALVYEMAVNHMLFSRYHVEIEGQTLTGSAWGEPVDPARHRPVVEVKGATFTALHVGRLEDGRWVAQTVVDV